MNKESQIVLDIHRRVYAEIGVDFDNLMDKGVTKEIGWYDNYFLAQGRQDEIIKDYLKELKLPKYKKRQIEGTVYLCALPKGV